MRNCVFHLRQTRAYGRFKQVRLFVPAGGSVPLTINPIQFTVRKADEVELPSSATVALAK